MVWYFQIKKHFHHLRANNDNMNTTDNQYSGVIQHQLLELSGPITKLNRRISDEGFMISID